MCSDVNAAVGQSMGVVNVCRVSPGRESICGSTTGDKFASNPIPDPLKN